MTLKKSLENRIRGWFPQEPKVSKAPTSTRFQTRKVQNRNSLSFKTRRWLRGIKAFTSSLLGQISFRTKIWVLAFGVLLFSDWLLYYLTIKNLIGGFVLHWAARITSPAVLILFVVITLYDFFKNRTFRKSHPIEVKSPNLKLGSIVVGVASVTILAYLEFSDLFLASQNLSGIGFYVLMVDLLLFFIAWGLYLEWRKKNKLSPFNST